MKVNQDLLIDRLTQPSAIQKREILIQNQESQIKINCITLSKDSKYLVCGGQNSMVYVYNLITKKTRSIKLNDYLLSNITAVYYIQDNESDEIKQTIFVGSQYATQEIDLEERDDDFELTQKQSKKQNHSTTLQSLYQYEQKLYTVSEKQIKVSDNGREVNVQNFSFKIRTSVFADGNLYLGLIQNQVLRIPLQIINAEIFASEIKKEFIIYQPKKTDEYQLIFETFSIFTNTKETQMAIFSIKKSKNLQISRQITFVQLIDNSEIIFETQKFIEFIHLVDQDYCCICFKDQICQILQLDFKNHKYQSIQEEKLGQSKIIGFVLLNNFLSSPLILAVDNQMSLTQYLVGARSKYQLPFVFWVWFRTIKDLELESLAIQSYPYKIMKEFRGEEGGKLVQSNEMVFHQYDFTAFDYNRLNQREVVTKVNILILYQVDEKNFIFFPALVRLINLMQSLKYLDLSYSKFQVEKSYLFQMIEEFRKKNYVLDFLGLAKLEIGKLFKVDETDPLDQSDFQLYQFIQQIDSIAENVSLRDNGFSDVQGKIIMQRTQEIRNLKMLDISNNAFQNLTLSALQMLMQKSAFFYRFDEDFTLKMLCISFTDELQETAMKAATDYLIRRRLNNNLYIYITRKQDTIWDTSISEYWTKALREKKVTCMAETFTIIVKCIKTTYWVIKRKGLYCMQQILFTTFFIKKYVACGFCTFLTTSVGKYFVAFFGVEPSYYEYNDEQVQLEQKLFKDRKCYFVLFFLYFSIYYSFVISFPISFVSQCSSSGGLGHGLYIIFIVASVIIEVYIYYQIKDFKIAHQYQTGPKWKRYCLIGKDILIGQLTKFTFFSCICFIVQLSACVGNNNSFLAAILIICINQFAEFVMLIKNVFHPYYNQTIQQIQVHIYLSIFLSMNVIRKQLQKWPEGENNYKFCGQERNSFKVPRQVFQIITTLILQDFPMLILQLNQGVKNSDHTTNMILLICLITMIIHFFYLIMKLLTVTRAGLINEDVALYEQQSKLSTQNAPAQQASFLQIFVKSFFRKIKKLNNEYDKRNYDILQSVDTDYFNYAIPMDQRVQNTRQVVAEDLISMKKAIPRQEEKKINFHQKVAQSQQLLNYYSRIYGKEVAAWKPSNDMPYCIIDTLLIDVPRTFFVSDLDWVKQYDLKIKNIKVTSLQQEVEGFDYAYEFFKDKKELDILDLGFGSGYVSLVLLALALRRNPRMIVRLYLVDHVKEAQDKFIGVLNSKFRDLKEKATFNFLIHDCIKGFTMFEDQKFDFIHMGFGATRWRIVNQIYPLLKQHGKLFGYKIITNQLQKQFTLDNEIQLTQDNKVQLEKKLTLVKELKEKEWKETREKIEKQFKYNLNNNLVNYGIMQPYQIQIKEQGKKLLNLIQRHNQCAICDKDLEEKNKQFINPYWGESICFSCGTNQLEQQGKERDIGKLKYKSDVIFYSGQDCDLSKINSFDFLLKQQQYKMGVEIDRTYRFICSACKVGQSEGFHYQCLVCTNLQGFCNQCGLAVMNLQASNQLLQNCFKMHPILRIMFPDEQKELMNQLSSEVNDK